MKLTAAFRRHVTPAGDDQVTVYFPSGVGGAAATEVTAALEDGAEEARRRYTPAVRLTGFTTVWAHGRPREAHARVVGWGEFAI